MRICAEPGRIAGLACAGEYGWDGWLGTYFANFPGQQMTIPEEDYNPPVEEEIL